MDPRRLSALAIGLCVTACSRAPVRSAAVGMMAVPTRVDALTVATLPETAPAPPEHWYFEWLSHDGQRALLRRLDGGARGTLQTRVVDVSSGATLAEDTFPELGALPTGTIGRRPEELAELVNRLAAPALGDDLVRGARMASTFPFGSCGPFSASPSGGSIAFSAGDWLYVADRSGHVQRRVAAEAAYDARYTPDGKHLFFRRASGSVDRVRAKYELFVMPADLSSAPRALGGSAGARDRFAVARDGRFAFAIASQEPHIKTCVLSIALKPPFAVKRIGCLDGGERFVESSLSPSGLWAAVTTESSRVAAPDEPRTLAWRLRVISVATGKVVFDEPAEPGRIVRAISDNGLLVQSGARGIVVVDVQTRTRRTFGEGIELGHRGFFRGPSELVVVRGSTVAVIDLSSNP